jgi:hypothetical protein
VKNELGFDIPEADILHSHRRENLKPYIIPVILSAPVSAVPSTQNCRALPATDTERSLK